MTESEWRTCDDALTLLTFLGQKASPRKLRLFGCACCRRVWEVHRYEPVPQGILVSEAFADGLLDQGELERLRAEHGARGGYSSAWAAHCAEGAALNPDASRVAAEVIGYAVEHSRYFVIEQRGEVTPPSRDPRLRLRHMRAEVEAANDAAEAEQQERATQAAITRDIFGNPFRPVTFDPRWQSETTVALAEGIYVERAFDRLPILADALEDVGCDDADVLAHCRGRGPHVRGCWAVDLILSKG